MKKLLIVCLLILAILVPTTPVFADGPEGDKVIIGENFTLASGETVNGSLIVVGGNATLEEGSRVRGDLVVTGGNAAVAGRVDGDMVVFGGRAHLQSTAIVEGQLVAIGGSLQRDEGAVVRGGEVKGFAGRYFFPNFRFFRPYRWQTWSFEEQPVANWFFGRVMDAVQAVFLTLVIMALGVLVVTLLPRHTDQVARVVFGSPLPSLGAGFAVLVITAILAALLILTCCFSPFGLLLLLALAIAVLFGWIAVGLVVGQRLLEALNTRQPMSKVVAVLVGLLLITLLTYMPCCLGFLFSVGVASLGLGAVILTRFGTQEYPLPTPEPPAREVEWPSEKETPVPESKAKTEEPPLEDQGEKAEG